MDEQGNDKRTGEGRQEVSGGRQALSELRAIRKSPLCSRCKAILVAIVLRQDSKTGITYTGIRRLSHDGGVRTRTVGFLLPLLQRAGMVKVIKRRNRTALRTVDVAAVKTSQKCTHASSENASDDISRLMDWKRRHMAEQEMPVLAEQEMPRAGRLSPYQSAYLSPPLGAPDGAGSPTVARLGAAPSGSLENKQKPSEEGTNSNNGFSFNGRFLKLTLEEERQIEQLIPSSFERTVQFTALDEALRERPIDPLASVKAWIQGQKAEELRAALKSKGWIR